MKDLSHLRRQAFLRRPQNQQSPLQVRKLRSTSEAMMELSNFTLKTTTRISCPLERPDYEDPIQIHLEKVRHNFYE